MRYRFFISLLLLTLGVALQFLFGGASGVWINCTLAILVAAAFYLDFSELVAIAFLSVFLLNWQPAFSWEMAAYILMPVAVFLARKFFPVERWLAVPAAIAAVFLAFYIILDPRFLIASPALFLWDLAGGLIVGLFACKGIEFTERY